MTISSTGLTRRSMIQKLILASGAISLSHQSKSQTLRRKKRMGVVITSYIQRRRQRKNPSKLYPPFKNALELIEHCHQSFNAGGVQTGAGGWSRNFAKQVRDKCEQYGMYLEGQISLPKDKNDVDRFESEIIIAKEAGVNVHRVALGGRRYEQFDKLEQFNAARERAWMKLRLAKPIVTKHRVKIGIENHKDWRITDMLDFMDELSNEFIGTCIDTGNSIALLEHPIETIEAFAKFAVTTHIKDMSVKEYEDGFLLSEVPIGEGFLNMNHLFDICEKANPDIQFSLEMITRNPLKIPCLTEKYWNTFEEIRGRRLANTLALVRKHQKQKSLPNITGLSKDEQYELEENNIAKCLAYAESDLGLRG